MKCGHKSGRNGINDKDGDERNNGGSIRPSANGSVVGQWRKIMKSAKSWRGHVGSVSAASISA